MWMIRFPYIPADGAMPAAVLSLHRRYALRGQPLQARRSSYRDILYPRLIFLVRTTRHVVKETVGPPPSPWFLILSLSLSLPFSRRQPAPLLW